MMTFLQLTFLISLCTFLMFRLFNKPQSQNLLDKDDQENNL